MMHIKKPTIELLYASFDINYIIVECHELLAVNMANSLAYLPQLLIVI